MTAVLPERSLALEAICLSVPPLPLPKTRTPGSTVQLSQPGAAAFERSTLAQPNLRSGEILLQSETEPQALSLCWAMYRFEALSPGDLPALLAATLTGEVPPQLYIGISDFSAATWRWTTLNEPQAGASAVVPGAAALDGGGNLYCIVAVFDGQQALLSQLSLQADIALPPPEGFSATTDRADGIALAWTDPAVSYDPDGN